MEPDLTKRRQDLFEYAKQQVYDTDVSNYIKYVYVDPNCSLMACTYNGRFVKFNSKLEFDMIPLFVDNSSRENVCICLD